VWRAVPPFLLRTGKLRDWKRKQWILYLFLSWGVKNTCNSWYVFIWQFCVISCFALCCRVLWIVFYCTMLSFHAQPDKVWVESWSMHYHPLCFARMLTPDPLRRRIIPILFTPTSFFPDTCLPQTHCKMTIRTYSSFSHYYYINGIIPGEAAFQACLEEKHVQSTSVR